MSSFPNRCGNLQPYTVCSIGVVEEALQVDAMRGWATFHGLRLSGDRPRSLTSLDTTLSLSSEVGRNAG